MSNELTETTRQPMLPAIFTKKTEEVFDVKENLRGIKAEVKVIEIVHRGQMFRIKGSSRPPFASFKGIIVYHHNSRSYWSGPVDLDRRQPPDCFSMDGMFAEPPDAQNDKCPIPPHQREFNEKKYGNRFVCSTCPKAAWGSDPKGGRGKACSEKHRLFILALDPELQSQIPYRLIVPPTSLANVNGFFTDLVYASVPHQIVITDFGLERKDKGGGVEYAELTLKADTTRRMPTEEQRELAKVIEMLKSQFQSAPDTMEHGETDHPAPSYEEAPPPSDDIGF